MNFTQIVTKLMKTERDFNVPFEKFSFSYKDYTYDNYIFSKPISEIIKKLKNVVSEDDKQYCENKEIFLENLNFEILLNEYNCNIKYYKLEDIASDYSFDDTIEIFLKKYDLDKDLASSLLNEFENFIYEYYLKYEEEHQDFPVYYATYVASFIDDENNKFSNYDFLFDGDAECIIRDAVFFDDSFKNVFNACFDELKANNLKIYVDFLKEKNSKEAFEYIDRKHEFLELSKNCDFILNNFSQNEIVEFIKEITIDEYSTNIKDLIESNIVKALSNEQKKEIANIIIEKYRYLDYDDIEKSEKFFYEVLGFEKIKNMLNNLLASNNAINHIDLIKKYVDKQKLEENLLMFVEHSSLTKTIENFQKLVSYIDEEKIKEAIKLNLKQETYPIKIYQNLTLELKELGFQELVDYSKQIIDNIEINADEKATYRFTREVFLNKQYQKLNLLWDKNCFYSLIDIVYTHRMDFEDRNIDKAFISIKKEYLDEIKQYQDTLDYYVREWFNKKYNKLVYQGKIESDEINFLPKEAIFSEFIAFGFNVEKAHYYMKYILKNNLLSELIEYAYNNIDERNFSEGYSRVIEFALFEKLHNSKLVINFDLNALEKFRLKIKENFASSIENHKKYDYLLSENKLEIATQIINVANDDDLNIEKLYFIFRNATKYLSCIRYNLTEVLLEKSELLKALVTGYDIKVKERIRMIRLIVEKAAVEFNLLQKDEFLENVEKYFSKHTKYYKNKERLLNYGNQ